MTLKKIIGFVLVTSPITLLLGTITYFNWRIGLLIMAASLITLVVMCVGILLMADSK